MGRRQYNFSSRLVTVFTKIKKRTIGCLPRHTILKLWYRRVGFCLLAIPHCGHYYTAEGDLTGDIAQNYLCSAWIIQENYIDNTTIAQAQQPVVHQGLSRRTPFSVTRAVLP
ncbi:hypothetical protein BRADI_2g35825v3 [Brachypodium distachyon]|uniref:Uncharacterized protein n=1 Tax=Brachypodium distachyon TaxID=15368 RepID=A0A2K2DC10_BRADI|nr:hypothetical protein BRADI_2g35825v3 [Brachypodium distachyon]